MVTPDYDEKFMRLAIELAEKCDPEPRGDRGPAPKVGVVIVKDGAEVSNGYRGEEGWPEGGHGEYIALGKRNNNGKGCTVYTTLEPCTQRSPDKTPCADRLIQSDVSTVVIGMLDPNPEISGKGVRRLREYGKRVYLFPPNLMDEVENQNAAFIHHYSRPRPPKAPVIQKLKCPKCRNFTDHELKFEHLSELESTYEPALDAITHERIDVSQAFACKGCDTVSFRQMVTGLDYAAGEEDWQTYHSLTLPKASRVDITNYFPPYGYDMALIRELDAIILH